MQSDSGTLVFRANAMPLSNRIDFIHDFKSLFIVRPINRTDMDDIITIHIRIVMHEFSNVMEKFAFDDHRDIAAPLDGFDETVREFLLNFFRQDYASEL